MKLFVYEVLEKLESTNSRNEKIAILKENENNRELKRVLNLALNPHIQFFIKKIPEYTCLDKGSLTLQMAFTQINKLSSRTVTGAAAKRLLVSILTDLKKHDADVIERIIKKDLACGVNASSVNKVWDKFIPSFNVMLCESYNQKNLERITFPAIIQTKSDGLRINFVIKQGKVISYTRNGKVLEFHGKLDQEILNIPQANQEVVLDGELLVVDDNENVLPRKTGNGILNKAGKGTITESEAEQIRFVVWDILPVSVWETQDHYHTPYKERFDYLCERIGATSPKYIKTSKTQIVGNMTDARDFFKAQLMNGEEGAILKNINSSWVAKRSKEQVKMKIEAIGDFVINAMEEGQGKHKGRLGAFMCASSDGKVLFSVGSGLSDEQRVEYWEQNMVGEIVSVKFNDIISSKSKNELSLFLPIFIEIRNDKDEADDLNKLQQEISC